MKVRIAATLLGAGVIALGGYQLIDSSAPPAKADRDAQLRAAQGSGLDPLTDQEIQTARHAALTGQPQAKAATGRPEVAFLFAQRYDDKNADGGPRTAEAQLYDYRTDELVIERVDLASGKVTKSDRLKDRQPGASADELRRAVGLVLADPKLGPGLRAQYQAETGRSPASADDFHTRGFVFDAHHAEAATNAAAFADCGRHRCFKVSLKLPGGRWIDTRRVVVDMSAQRVLTLHF